MKKTLALILAFAMVFSTITVAFAEEEVVEAVAEEVAEEAVEEVAEVVTVVSDEAKALATIGMLEGTGAGVTAEYTATELNRLTASIMILKLKGLYEEALKYEGENNFVDAEEVVWAEGRNILAYVKDNPVGFGGNEKGEFMPYDTLSEQMLYKVLLENLGYKQVTTDVADGDFAWEETLEFAESLGLKPAKAAKFTVNGLAQAVVAALKTNMKDGKAWIEVLVESGKVDADLAVAAELMEEAKAVEVAVDEVKAIGNTVVEVVFEDDVDEAALGNADNYEIEGLEIKEVVVAGSDTVRLETAAMTAGKVYIITVGEEKVKFTGVAKISGGPELEDAVSEDVEEVVLTFNKNLDFESATDISNYSIANVEIVNAEVDGDEVTLTTAGLKNKQRYTIKVTNIKSIDGVSRRSTSRSFSTRVDTAAPRIDSNETEVQTNQRIVLYFNEKVTKETAEDLANYVIKENKTDGDELEVLSVTWDKDDKNNVEIVTEPQNHKTKYKLSVNNIADRRKVANIMTRPSTFTFTGMKEDKTAPKLAEAKAISSTAILVKFTDESKIDENSALDPSSYSFEKGSEDLDVEDVIKVKSEHKLFKALLIVEGMETGKKHTLKVIDIMDEFGNAITRETSKTVTPKHGDFASAKLEKLNVPYYPIVTNKNTIILKFDKDLVEETAENIANYSINKDIGAPTKAEYDDDKCEVTLTVNELTQGEEYKLTIDGVEDLAGNVLLFKDVKFSATPTKYGDIEGKAWDDDAPELYDVYTVNKYVVALEFDEEVEYVTKEDGGIKVSDTYLLLTGGDYEADSPLKLRANSLVDDDTVIEFSNYGVSGLETWEGLKEDAVYTVVGVVYGDGALGAIKDLAGNIFFEPDAEEDDFEFDGTEEEPEPAYVENYEQVNGRTFEITMSKNVMVKQGTTTVKGITFDIEVDGDDKNVVIFKGNSYKNPIKENTEYTFELNKILTDEHGWVVEDEDYDEKETVLVGEYTDEDKPYIIDVVVVDRETIEIEFSEQIESAVGAFKLKNIDTDKNVSIKTIDDNDDIDGAVVTLKLNNALEGRYEYELTMIEKKVKDFVGLTADEDVFYFYGTDLAKQPKKLN